MEKNWLKTGLRTNVFLMILIALIVFVLVNYINYRHYKRYDWTQSSLYSLSDKTKKILSSLNEPLEIIVLYQPTHNLYTSIQDLLKEYSYINNKMKIEYIDPDKDVARTEMIANKYKIDALNLIIFNFKGKFRVVSDIEMADYDLSNMQSGESPRLKAFKGEEVFTSAILSIQLGKQTKAAYFVTGHGERELVQNENGTGIERAINRLKRDNIIIDNITLLDKAKVPDDADVLLIIGPAKSFVPDEIEILDKYLQNGGRLFLAQDPMCDSGLEEYLKKWGIFIGNNIVVDPDKKMPFTSEANLYINKYTSHPIVQNMKSIATLFYLTRSVDFDPETKDFDGMNLALTEDSGWGEINVNSNPFVFDQDKDRRGPISIGAAAKSKDTKGMRIVVFGDSDFLIDSQILSLGNADIFLNSINWLISREKIISIGPKTPQNIYLTLNSDQVNNIFWFSVVALPAISMIIGTIVLIVRR